ncbi:MAG TPA: hypothetical protein VN631_06645, partial [Negativicutes bacterium]|nr:hypothetical protein [Negativicutes bacterium]
EDNNYSQDEFEEDMFEVIQLIRNWISSPAASYFPEQMDLYLYIEGSLSITLSPTITEEFEKTVGQHVANHKIVMVDNVVRDRNIGW